MLSVPSSSSSLSYHSWDCDREASATVRSRAQRLLWVENAAQRPLLASTVERPELAGSGSSLAGMVWSYHLKMTTLRINRAPVLTLWASVVAEQLGLPHDTALTAGQAVAGMTAYAKGVRLGIYAQPIDSGTKPALTKPEGSTGTIKEFMLLGRIVHIADTKDGPRAINKGEIAKPQAVEKYLRSKFGDQLDAVLGAMVALARSLPPKELNANAFHLYEQFRPEVPPDEKGWGAKGVLDLNRIAALAAGNR